MAYDLVSRGGSVADGTGIPAESADVAIHVGHEVTRAVMGNCGVGFAQRASAALLPP